MNAGGILLLVLSAALLGWALFLMFSKKGKAMRQKAEDDKRALEEQGVRLAEYVRSIGGVKAGKYLTGHPELPAPIDTVVVGVEGVDMVILNGRASDAVGAARIPLAAIENIYSEDHSTMRERVTASRLLMQGDLAYLNKKQEKVEVHYVVVKWRDGKFQHETIFENTGKDSISEANALRSLLIKHANAVSSNPDV